MRSYLIKSVVATICLTMMLVPAPVTAQSSDLGLTIRVTPTIASPGTTVGVVSMVTNNSSSKLRTTVTFTSTSPCGGVASLGYNKVALNPGQTVMVTVTYPIATAACLGTYAIAITAKSGGGKGSTAAASPSATTYLTVQ